MKYSISHVANLGRKTKYNSLTLCIHHSSMFDEVIIYVTFVLHLLMAGPFSLNCNTCMKDYSNDDNVV